VYFGLSKLKKDFDLFVFYLQVQLIESIIFVAKVIN